MTKNENCVWGEANDKDQLPDFCILSDIYALQLYKILYVFRSYKTNITEEKRKHWSEQKSQQTDGRRIITRMLQKIQIGKILPIHWYLLCIYNCYVSCTQHAEFAWNVYMCYLLLCQMMNWIYFGIVSRWARISTFTVSLLSIQQLFACNDTIVSIISLYSDM